MRLDRNRQLDGLRGIAALAVAVHHTILALGQQPALDIWYARLRALQEPYTIALKMVLMLSAGDVAVTLFFVLSGAVLFHSLMLERRPPISLATNFIYRRFLRIYPALLVALIVYFLLQQALGWTVSWPDLLDNAALWSFAINGPTWTLNVEFVAVPVFLAAWLAYRRQGELGMIVAFLLLWLLAVIPWFKPFPELFRPAALAFVLGMLIPTRIGQWLADRFPARLAIVVVVVMLTSRTLIESVRTGSMVQQVCAALLVMLLYYDKLPALGSLLRGRFAQFTGQISYSFYLYHTLLVILVVNLLTALAGAAASARPLEYGLAASVAVIGLTIPVAYVSKLWCEDPFIRLGRTNIFKAASWTGSARAKPAE